jgi:hypothetical protein
MRRLEALGTAATLAGRPAARLAPGRLPAHAQPRSGRIGIVRLGFAERLEQQAAGQGRGFQQLDLDCRTQPPAPAGTLADQGMLVVAQACDRDDAVGARVGQLHE